MSESSEMVCLEAALAFRNEMFDIVSADGNATVVFPHVDSCVAVIFLHAKGKATCGHVSQTTAGAAMEGRGPVGQAESLADMLPRMHEWSNATPVEQVIFVGHPSWRGICATAASKDPLLAKAKCVNLCDYNDPLDIFAELGAQKLRIQKWVSNPSRDATQVPARQGEWLYEGAL